MQTMTNEPQTQRAELARVRTDLHGVVFDFCRSKAGHLFTSSDLDIYCLMKLAELQKSCAPASPGRILRLLRREGLIDYTVVNRRSSTYRMTHVAGYFESGFVTVI